MNRSEDDSETLDVKTDLDKAKTDDKKEVKKQARPKASKATPKAKAEKVPRPKTNVKRPHPIRILTAIQAAPDYFLNMDSVKVLQQRLKDLDFDPGNIDGKYEAKTRAAVESYQKQVKNLKVDGIAGSNTLRDLFN